ncbi:Leucine-rich repeat receptor protein kinase HPCA1-like protein [Drosera capensis]
MAAGMLRLMMVLAIGVICAWIGGVSSATDARDAAVLQSLKDEWQHTPPSWDRSDDACAQWEGVTCNNSRVTALHLSTMGLKGKLSGDIGGLTALRTLDLSFNRGLTGTLTPALGDLSNLSILILAGCGFTGSIPAELGKLSQLAFFALNSNYLTGGIPPSLGNLSNVYWLDFSDNQLTGPLPVSTKTSPGLDLLLKTKHFHFNKNQLSGSIPPNLFHPDMKLIHVLFDGNHLTGSIPSTLGLVKDLEALRLDRNNLTGEVPSNLNNLTNIIELNLAYNKLTGAFPNLTGMDSASYVDLSHNSFDETEVPDWFSTLQSLTTLVNEYGSLRGPLPQALFSFPQLQQVKLRNNLLNGTLNMGDNVNKELQLVDLQNNYISAVTLGLAYTSTVTLTGNPVCDQASLSSTVYCQPEQQISSYSTSLAICGSKTCLDSQKLIPGSCGCAYPYEGTLYFRAPSFRELTNATVFQLLELSLWTKLGLSPGFVSLQNPFFNGNDYLQVELSLFPSTGMYFNRTEVQRFGFDLSNQTYKPPHEFGPYYFLAAPYKFPDMGRGTFVSLGLIVGIATGCAFLVLLFLGVAIYAVRQRKRAEKATELSNPFVSWGTSQRDSGGAPQLKGARWFSYDELKKSTNSFSENNVLGSGGYGKVYRGTLADGQIVAIKRAQQGSMQGGHEFKTEIEMLSRVHHKNLVNLVGFCFEQGEQMLVYEFMANGSLKDSLSGRSGIHLDWKRRLRIALGTARGLSYLHELANPPIIHRDVKSTNILLDENLNAKVADFGLSKMISDTKGHVSTQVKGTLGYLDPEYYLTQQLTEKSDVYSFGVVMLELLTGRPPLEKGKYIVREVRSSINTNNHDFHGLGEMIDPAVKTAKPSLAGYAKYSEVAMRCVGESALARPSMSEVVKAIEAILQIDGLNTSSNSASSSATELTGATKATARHPYDGLQVEDGGDGSDDFDYSGGYGLAAEVEPK